MIIKSLRLQNAWSQEKLAQLTNLSTRTIQRIEKDDSASLESLSLLANAFNLDITELQNKINNKQNKPKSKNKISKKITIFILVNLLLFTINILTSTEHLWFIYPLLGWGIPLFYKIYKQKILNDI